jgi:hypothetical protein
MPETSNYYNEAFPVGSEVRIASRAFVEDSMATWKYHHKLQPAQLEFADRVTKVRNVGVYHGGDAVYSLEDTPGSWLEQCLQRATT